MDRVGVLVVCYGSRGTAIVDALCRSEEYSVELYIADRNRNPFNVEKAEQHAFIADLDIGEITKFVVKNKDKIDFGIVGPEGPIISGIRDVLEKRTGIPIICPTRKYAIEGSKVAQRRLFQEVVPDVNPRFMVFDPKDYANALSVKKDLWKWLDELDNQAVVKPDAITAGKGVGVWGDHFSNRRELFQHFQSNYKYGPVIVEEKIFGEESSFQAFCDGKHLVPLPETRDYKRAFDGDKGPNTGGMGSYKDSSDLLPFMTLRDREREIEAINRIFVRLKGKGSDPGLRGVPFYVAFIHTTRGVKILENNSRPGDPEIQNLLPILEDDFVEICFKIIDGNLTKVEFDKLATVVTYKVPSSYGGRLKEFRGDKQVFLGDAYRLCKEHHGRMWVYPGAMELRDGKTFELTSRTVCVVGAADKIDMAREISQQGIRAIQGGSLWYRTDVASRESIERSIEHMKRLRSK